MIRSLFRVALKLGMVGSVVAVAVKALGRRRSASSASDWSAGTEPWPPIDLADQPAPGARGPGPVAAAVVEDVVVEDVEAEAVTDGDGEGQVWSDPHDDGSCPVTHPVKAKLASGVFHLPGMANYERTKADRCYPDADTARADDLRQAKR
ncbi:MAG: hypothetical protein H0V52_02400 [Acidimicrobiia bacterium]|nr:hypothetical protein [Acidimicrobiia bacterium]